VTTTVAISPHEVLVGLAAIAGADHAWPVDNLVRVAPANAEGIAQVLRFAQANGLSVVPTGSGSKLNWGNPVSTDVELSLERLSTLREHAWEDLTCTVQAGCSWATMQNELARHGQMVALDPLWPDRATVGGVVATNDSGTLRLRYGGLRDLIIGMTLVLADGAIAKTGGKVVKNVAGYDLHKLLTGSFGTLAVITEVNFRLHPIEQHTRTFTATVPDVALLDRPLADLSHSQMTPSGIQLRLGQGVARLDVRISTRPECFDEHIARLRQVFNPLALAETDESAWQTRQQLFASAGGAVLKASMMPSDICSVAAELQQISADAGINLALVVQACGLATISLTSALGSDANALIALINHLRARLRTSGGSAVLLRAPDVLRGRIDPWDCQSDALPLMREIKRRFDPKRVLSPGRFVGGI
jgi:glycolate oxidase FAD binding subunit